MCMETDALACASYSCACICGPFNMLTLPATGLIPPQTRIGIAVRAQPGCAFLDSKRVAGLREQPHSALGPGDRDHERLHSHVEPLTVMCDGDQIDLNVEIVTSPSSVAVQPQGVETPVRQMRRAKPHVAWTPAARATGYAPIQVGRCRCPVVFVSDVLHVSSWSDDTDDGVPLRSTFCTVVPVGGAGDVALWRGASPAAACRAEPTPAQYLKPPRDVGRGLAQLGLASAAP